MKLRWRRSGAAIALAAVLLLAGWARISNYPMVLGTGELLPQMDGDSYYHLHRSLETLAHYPRVPHFDPAMNWPKGAFVPWADGFDLGAATFALLLGGRGHPDRARIAIALWPVLLGVLSVWATMALAELAAPGRRWRGAALAAGLCVALMPDAVAHGRFGRIDHHVFEACAVLWLAAWSLRRLPTRPGPPARPAAVRFELEGALCSAIAVYGFSGSPLYVAVAALPLAWAALRDGRWAGSGGPGLLFGALLSAALTLPALLDHGQPLSFKLPSLLQPVLLACAGTGLLACAAVGAARAARWRRPWPHAILCLTVLPVLVLLAPPVLHQVQAGLAGWLLHRDPWLATVREFKPLLSGGIGESWWRVYGLMGWPAAFLPLFLAAVALGPARRSPRVAGLLALTVLLTGLACLQVRFARAIAPVLAVSVGLAVAMAARAACARLGGRGWWRRPAWVALLAVLALDLADVPSRDLLTPTGVPRSEPFVEAALDLRDAPTPPGLERGVLCNWSFGHHIQVLSGRPVVVNGFGSYLDAPEFWGAAAVFTQGEPELDAYLAEHRIGVLIAGAGTLGNEVRGLQGEPSFDRGILNEPYMRGRPLSPLLIAGSGIPEFGVRHLAHLLPRFAAHSVVGGLKFRLPYLWSYEQVRGAVVRGRAAAGARVVAALGLVEQGRPHVYRAWVDAGPDGRWELVLPVPTDFARPTLYTAHSWTVSAPGADPVRFQLAEAAVRAGSALELPPLRLAAKGGTAAGHP